MAEVHTKSERRSAVLTAMLGVVAAALTALSSFLAVTKADVAQQRDDVRTRASTLSTKKSSLEREVDTLSSENATLRRQLRTASKASGSSDHSGSTGSGSTAAAPDVVRRTLTVPLPDSGAMGVFLDNGTVTTSGCCGGFSYERQHSTGRPQLVANRGGSYYSTAVPSPVTPEGCIRAIQTSPTITALRPLHSGLQICASTDAGTSLLEILEAPQKNGTLKISQRFWPAPGP